MNITGRSTSSERPREIADWLITLIRAGVYPPMSQLPSLATLATAMVSDHVAVARALRLLDQQDFIAVRHGVRPVVLATVPVPVLAPADLSRLLTRLKPLVLPDTDLSGTGIAEMCRRARARWATRSFALAREQAEIFGALATAAHHLIPLAAEKHPHHPDVLTPLRRAAVTALAEDPPTVAARSWRTACLGAAVREVLVLAGVAC
ncbi:GntR family transcriptional regulator [Streptomyces sp. NPDC001493]